jgi:uncharacterized protein (DUF58 family)
VQRYRLLSLLIYGLVILGMALLRGQMLALAVPFLLYLGAGLLRRPEGLRLRVQRTLSAERVPQGSPVTVKLSVTNEGQAIPSLLLEDVIPRGLELLDGEARTLTPLAAGGTVELEYAVIGQRGYYQFQTLHATATEHLGLFHQRTELQVTGRLFLLPRVQRLPLVAIRPRKTRVYSGLIPARRGGPGVEFFGVREYQPGDAWRWINHRATARHHQSLFVNEFEQERAVDVGLILDGRHALNYYGPRRSLFEYSVEATATLADSLLRHGNRVGLFIYGGFFDWTFPGYGRVQRERILQALARARLYESQVFDQLSRLPTRLFPIRSQLILVSPLRPTDLDDLISLRARGYPLLIISPDPIDFEKRALPDEDRVKLAARIARLERAHLFHQLRQAGVRLFEWQINVPFHQAARHALGRVPLWSRGPRGGR